MRPAILIPARLAATRLPGKPLADIHGEPMIVHVWRRAREADFGPVVVACCDEAVAEAVQQVGGTAVMTDPEHPSGSDRIHEALTLFDPDRRHDVVVNMQGDLPTLTPADLRLVLTPLREAEVDIATLAATITRIEERSDTNVVKIAVAFAPRAGAMVGRALYFSRAPIPAGDGPLYHHIGIYGYRREALRRFVALEPSPLEKREKLEQLRALEAGMRIDVALAAGVPLGVDTPAELERARALLAHKRE